MACGPSEPAEPTRLVGELAQQFGGEIPELSVKRPSLEDVYLELVGKPAAVDDDAMAAEGL